MLTVELLRASGSDTYELRLDGDPAAAEWQRLETAGTPPPARAFHGAAYDATNNDMLIHGGYSVDPRGDAWMLDLDAPRPMWRRVSLDPSPVLDDPEFTRLLDVLQDFGQSIARRDSLSGLGVPIGGGGLGQARALQGTLSALGVASYALVGNDTGGWVARELALIDTPRVSHLVLTNTERFRPSARPGFRCTKLWRDQRREGDEEDRLVPDETVRLRRRVEHRRQLVHQRDDADGEPGGVPLAALRKAEETRPPQYGDEEDDEANVETKQKKPIV